MRGLLKVVFLPNYNVSAAEVIVPASDLSEQISTAGMEASGTGNMKLALNGALTIGTLDGAKVEMAEHIGAEQHVHLRPHGRGGRPHAAPRAGAATTAIDASPDLAETLEAIGSGVFSHDDPGRYRDLVDSLRGNDWFMVAADFDAYLAAQRAGRRALPRRRRPGAAPRCSTRARMGWFSSDRTIAEYAAEIWGIPQAS